MTHVGSVPLLLDTTIDGRPFECSGTTSCFVKTVMYFDCRLYFFPFTFSPFFVETSISFAKGNNCS